MNAADKLRNELNNETANIIADRFEPNKDKAMEIIARGIKRIGYVCIDTFNHTSTCEGGELSVALGHINNKDLNALHTWLTKEGFNVSKQWWGYSSNGIPDMVKITI